MKKLIILLLMIISMTIYAKEIEYSTLEKTNDIHYQNGQKFTGKAVVKFPNGKPWKIEEFKNGEKDGIAKVYDEIGNLIIEINVKKNKMEGISRVYYQNGQLKNEWQYKNGQLNGESNEYYETGELKAKTSFKDGYNNGRFKFYNKKGEITREAIYENGKTVSDITY